MTSLAFNTPGVRIVLMQGGVLKSSGIKAWEPHVSPISVSDLYHLPFLYCVIIFSLELLSKVIEAHLAPCPI